MRDYCYLEVGGEVVFVSDYSKIAVLSEGALAPLPGACAPPLLARAAPPAGDAAGLQGSSPLCQEGGTNGLQSLHPQLSAHPSATSVRCLALF